MLSFKRCMLENGNVNDRLVYAFRVRTFSNDLHLSSAIYCTTLTFFICRNDFKF